MGWRQDKAIRERRRGRPHPTNTMLRMKHGTWAKAHSSPCSTQEGIHARGALEMAFHVQGGIRGVETVPGGSAERLLS